MKEERKKIIEEENNNKNDEKEETNNNEQNKDEETLDIGYENMDTKIENSFEKTNHKKSNNPFEM